MFGLFKRKDKPLKEMSLKEVTAHLYDTFPSIRAQGDYESPKFRCTRWILLHGPFYQDKEYRCSILIDVAEMYSWALKHAFGVAHSDERKEAAKNFLPEWIKSANIKDEAVTLLDKDMQKALYDWDLDFITFGWARVWCPECQGFTEIFRKVQHQFNQTNDRLKCASNFPEWNCEFGHNLRKQKDEMVRFF